MPQLPPLFTELHTRFRTRFPEFYRKLPAFRQLTRVDRPIGTLLLLWPTLSALWIAAGGFPSWHLLFIFITGTFLMRAAGCCINDFADANIDGYVARTENRPLATGALTRQDALYCFAALTLVVFVLVLFTNLLTVMLSFVGLAIASLYPFMKRYTHLPQVVLGLAFSWGMIMAFAAQTGSVPLPAFLLFVANVLWTIAYDTEYAMVDREYDLKIGVKSTAILFGDADRMIIGVLQAMFLVALLLAGRRFELGGWYYLSLAVAAGLLIYQQWLIRDRAPGPCFKAFLNNNRVGAAIFAGIVLHYSFAS
ncbi:MAG: 4-hydroxybenzoate octaprenyltransferase [Pseudohongiellaceae bacterium]